MGGLVTAWPCGEQRRLRRDWTSRPERSTAGPKKASYDDLQRRQRSYMRHRAVREIDRQRKELTSTIARILASLESRQAEKTLEQRFQEQADKWQRETQHLSSPAQRMMHPSYQAILGMGNENPREIISLMIRDMQQHRRPWFWALSYFAQDNPVSQSDAGRTDKMIKAWVDWEKAKRLP